MDCFLLFKEIIAVYSENHVETSSAFCRQNAKLLARTVTAVCLWLKDYDQIDKPCECTYRLVGYEAN
jgi:hypothetical protein